MVGDRIIGKAVKKEGKDKGEEGEGGGGVGS